MTVKAASNIGLALLCSEWFAQTLESVFKVELLGGNYALSGYRSYLAGLIQHKTNKISQADA
jgi:hypothetical protein